MGPIILDGKSLAKGMEPPLAERAARIRERRGRAPGLATVMVGDNPASAMYVRMKGNACRRVGVEPVRIDMPEGSTTAEVIGAIERLNADPGVSGILLQHPLPRHVDEMACFNAISVAKDVDGVCVSSFGMAAMGMEGHRSATSLSIVSILRHYGIPIEGREAVVVGRSPILGKPVSMLLLNENATVTICHSRTVGLPDVVRRADIVVGALGRPRFIKADWVKEGAVLVDAGYNEGNVGDIDLENAAAKSSAYTPVPGGVGPMTIMQLISQTVRAAEMVLGIG